MNNVSMKQEGKKLIIEVDLSKEFGLSKSGKTTTIASTNGFTPVSAENVVVYVNLNVYKK